MHFGSVQLNLKRRDRRHKTTMTSPIIDKTKGETKTEQNQDQRTPQNAHYLHIYLMTNIAVQVSAP